MYTQKVLDHFKDPHNQGSIKDADAVGQEGNPVCGDVIKVYMNIKDNVIKEIKFETLGCAAAIAVSSATTDLVIGKTLEEALEMTKDDVIDDLGGLPPTKIHCSMLGVDALHKAIKEYMNKMKDEKNNK
jgi:nitrogen fixation NifU-like protein